MAPTTSKIITYEEYLEMPGEEVVGGEIVTMPPAGYDHSYIVQSLALIFQFDPKVVYESIGVPEFWIVSSEARTFEVLQLQEGKLRTTQIVNSGQLHPLRFPETAVDVASVWPD